MLKFSISSFSNLILDSFSLSLFSINAWNLFASSNILESVPDGFLDLKLLVYSTIFFLRISYNSFSFAFLRSSFSFFSIVSCFSSFISSCFVYSLLAILETFLFALDWTLQIKALYILFASILTSSLLASKYLIFSAFSVSDKFDFSISFFVWFNSFCAAFSVASMKSLP